MFVLCVSVCACVELRTIVTLFLRTSELFGRVGQVSSIRLDHTPVINEPAMNKHNMGISDITVFSSAHYCQSL